MDSKVALFFAENGFDLAPIFTGENTSTVSLAAAVLGVEEDRIAKSLGFRLKDKAIVLVVSGTSRIDNRKYKDLFGCKATMMSVEETLEITGFPVGGVCPFALPETVDIYLDESLKKHKTVYPAAGTRDSAVEVEVVRFSEYTGGVWVDVCKDFIQEGVQ